MRLFNKFVFAALFAVAPLSAKATLIQFDDGVDGAVLNAHYQALGVTFSNAVWTSTNGLAGSSGSLGIRASQGYQWISRNPVIALFSSSVTMVSVDGIDVGANGLRINAYDALTGGNLVSFQEVFGTGLGEGQFYQVKASANSIKRVEIFQASRATGEGIILDNFKFESASVHAPASVALMAFGFVGICLTRRRRNVIAK